MLRIKRSVQATYNTQVNFMSSQMLAAQSAAKTEVQGTVAILPIYTLTVPSTFINIVHTWFTPIVAK